MRNGRIWIAVLGLSAMASFTGCGSSEMKPSTPGGMQGDSMMAEEKMMGDEKMKKDEPMKDEKMMSGEKE